MATLWHQRNRARRKCGDARRCSSSSRSSSSFFLSIWVYEWAVCIVLNVSNAINRILAIDSFVSVKQEEKRTAHNYSMEANQTEHYGMPKHLSQCVLYDLCAAPQLPTISNDNDVSSIIIILLKAVTCKIKMILYDFNVLASLPVRPHHHSSGYIQLGSTLHMMHGWTLVFFADGQQPYTLLLLVSTNYVE